MSWSFECPEELRTPRLILRRPQLDDAAALHARVTSEPLVTRYVSWPCHPDVEATRGVLRRMQAMWSEAGLGAFLVMDAQDGQLLGTTGLQPHGDAVETGYVLARDAWGRGVATEALRAMLELARGLGVPEVVACVHPCNTPSMRVLDKCGFERRASDRLAAFPNLGSGVSAPVYDYVLRLREA